MADTHSAHSTPDSPRRFSAGTHAMEIKFKSQASIALEELVVALEKMTVHLQRVQKTLTGLGRSVVDKPRRLQARYTKEDDFRKCLRSCQDATVVTNGHRRLVYANPKALDLFGVSELNIRNFTIDTFLSDCEILGLRRKWFLIRRDERYGKCKITRLDGSLRVAEYVLVDDITPRLHLYRFLNVAPPRGITQFLSGHPNRPSESPGHWLRKEPL